MFVKQLAGIALGLVCVALLSSCSLLPVGSTGNKQQDPDTEMRHIADAVKHHDSAALKKLFSPGAREKAPNLDSGLKYFLSVLEPGRLTWKSMDGQGSSDQAENGWHMEETFSGYEVSSNGKKYEVYFANFTVNTKDPKNVGLYALGVTPYSAQVATSPGVKTPFDEWASQFDSDTFGAGDPAVYVPQK